MCLFIEQKAYVFKYESKNTQKLVLRKRSAAPFANPFFTPGEWRE